VGRYKVLPARVIAIGPAQGFSWTVTIDAGSRDGLRVDMTVLNGDGLVGRIKNVSSSTSTVLLAADPSVRVGVRLERTLHVGGRDRSRSGAARGGAARAAGRTGGGGPVRDVRLARRSAVRRGCAGRRGRQREGRRRLPDQAGHRQAVRRLHALDLVGVVVEPPRTDPRDAVLPPAPAKTPTPKP
jgi:rod shape-determining protein MreC